MPRDPLGIRRGDERRPRRVGVPWRRFHRPSSRDRVPRPPEVEVVLVVPAVDRRVRPAHVQQREESRGVGGVEVVPGDELPGDLVPAQTWRALPPLGDVRLVGSPGRAVGSAEGLDLVELSGPLRAVERGRRHAAELRRALDEERLHAAHPRGRIEDRQPGRRVDQRRPLSDAGAPGPIGTDRTVRRPTLASSMALAAACPIAMPWRLNALLPIAPSDAARSVESALRSPARPGNGARSGAPRDECGKDVVRRRCDGRVDRRLRARTRLEEIRLMLLRPDRVDGVVDGALHDAQVDLERRRRAAVRRREGASVVAATWFQWDTSLPSVPPGVRRIPRGRRTRPGASRPRPR